MKQLLNLVFWCLTLCTLVVPHAAINCGNHGARVDYSGFSFCVCNCPWKPSNKDKPPHVTVSPNCPAYLGTDCSKRGSDTECTS
jgi:hypothetical protein